jgi:dipeptidyl aminopeptidase/acylaminoacyl peptidase
MNTHSIPAIEDYLSTRRAFQPDISPSGKKILYLSNENDDTPQIYLKNLEDSTVKQLTKDADAILFAWFSPVDDSLIIFSKAVGGNEQFQLYLLQSETGKVEDLTHNEAARYGFGGWTRDGKRLLFSSTERNGIDYDAYILNLETKESQCIYTLGGWSYGMGFSPSGRYALIGQSPSNVTTNIYVIDTKNATEPQQILSVDEPARYFAPRWLNDESGFFLISNRDKNFNSIFFYSLGDDTLQEVLSLDWDVENIQLNRQNDAMTITVNEDGHTSTYLYSVNGSVLTRDDTAEFSTGETYGIQWSNDGSSLVYVREDYDSPPNIWMWDRKTNTHKCLTAITSLVDKTSFVKPELIHYESFDGLRIPAFVYTPKNVQGAAPAIVRIHGGPEDQYKAGFVALTQFFVAQGYVVVAPNVRGSSGYGKTYVSLDDKRKRLDSVEDLRALHDWAKTQQKIDEDRIALMGGSYGGYMVLAGLAFQPELWATGVDIVGIANFVTFLQNTAPYRRKLREAEYGSLEEDYDFLVKVSPINKIDQVKAPLLVIHGENDPRVPLSEAEQVRDSLQESGVAAELIVYGDEGHGIAKLKNQLDLYPKVSAFLAKNLGV